HEKDLNTRGAYLHVLGDLASSVGVVVGAVIIAQTGLTWVDPLLSLLIALLIGGNALGLFWEAFHILLESAPQRSPPERIAHTLKQEVPEILEVHHVHLWEVGAGEVHLTAHLVLKEQALGEAQRIVERAGQTLRQKLQVAHSTLQMEVKSPIRMKGPEV